MVRSNVFEGKNCECDIKIKGKGWSKGLLYPGNMVPSEKQNADLRTTLNHCGSRIIQKPHQYD